MTCVTRWAPAPGVRVAVGPVGAGGGRGGVVGRGRWQCDLFSPSSAFLAGVVAESRGERHNRTTLVKRGMACAILVRAVSELCHSRKHGHERRFTSGTAGTPRSTEA